MNYKQIQYNMEEIVEEATNILNGVKRGPGYTPDEYYQAMRHLIHHVNTAWNARDVSLDEAEAASPAQREAWGRFPTDIRLI